MFATYKDNIGSLVLSIVCGLYRGRLATLDVDLPPHIAAKRGRFSSNYGMISLLCALFLSKQGAGEAAEAIDEKLSEVCTLFSVRNIVSMLLNYAFLAGY